jgi:type IV pilus assembly protein PilM
MGLFGPKKQSYLGVDFGSGGIKLVELKSEKGRSRLFTYGFQERMPGVEPVNMVDDPNGTAQILREMLKKSRTTTLKAVGGLPVASVFSSVVTVPRAKKEEEIREAARWQAKKLIPVPLDEMKLDFKIIDGSSSSKSAGAKKSKDKKDNQADKTEESKTVQVLITGAATAMIQKYVSVFNKAGLELTSLETETFALIRSLVGKDRSTTMIVDVGSVRTNILIVENGIPYVTRSVDMGGSGLTRAMGKALELGVKEAEEMKTDIKSVQTIYPGEGIPKIFEAAMAPLVTELQYSINLYAGQGEDNGNSKRVEKIILTGGTASLPAVSEYFAEQLNTRTYVGDPWARVAYPEGLRPILDEIGPRFAVAIGLAMQNVE